MARFRPRPRIVEAEQWFPGKEVEGVVTEMKSLTDGSITPVPAHVRDCNGQLEYVLPGDWVIRSDDGLSHCVMSNGRFRFNFEPDKGKPHADVPKEAG